MKTILLILSTLFVLPAFSQSSLDVTCHVFYISGPFNQEQDTVVLYAGESKSKGSIVSGYETKMKRSGTGAVLGIRPESQLANEIEFSIQLDNVDLEKREPKVLKESKQLSNGLTVTALCRAS